jgi:hypothetical protein
VKLPVIVSVLLVGWIATCIAWRSDHIAQQGRITTILDDSSKNIETFKEGAAAADAGEKTARDTVNEERQHTVMAESLLKQMQPRLVVAQSGAENYQRQAILESHRLTALESQIKVDATEYNRLLFYTNDLKSRLSYQETKNDILQDQNFSQVQHMIENQEQEIEARQHEQNERNQPTFTHGTVIYSDGSSATVQAVTQ